MLHPNKKELIKKIVKLAYASVFLKGEKPLSLILLAPPENSKTHFIVGYKTKYSKIVTDLSYFGLLDLLENDKKLKQIIIPDFLKVTEKNQNTKKSLISSLNAYLEEGIYDIKLANKEKKDLKGRIGGVITATTDASFYQNVKSWNGMGFKSRFLCVSWKYGKESMNEILEKIVSEKEEKRKVERLVYKITKIENNHLFNEKLKKLAENSPRRLNNLIVLLKTIALVNGHSKPTKTDFKELEELNTILNLRFNEI